MRKMIAVSALAALFLMPAAQAQAKIQSQLGDPVQFVPLNQDMKNFLNRYAKATINKSYRTFDTVLGIGGVVLVDPEISKLNIEDLFREMDKEVVNNRAEYGRDAKVFMDKPRNVIVMTTNEPGAGPALSLIQIRGQRMLLTACGL